DRGRDCGRRGARGGPGRAARRAARAAARSGRGARGVRGRRRRRPVSRAFLSQVRVGETLVGKRPSACFSTAMWTTDVIDLPHPVHGMWISPRTFRSERPFIPPRRPAPLRTYVLSCLHRARSRPVHKPFPRLSTPLQAALATVLLVPDGRV